MYTCSMTEAQQSVPSMTQLKHVCMTNTSNVNFQQYYTNPQSVHQMRLLRISGLVDSDADNSFQFVEVQYVDNSFSVFSSTNSTPSFHKSQLLTSLFTCVARFFESIHAYFKHCVVHLYSCFVPQLGFSILPLLTFLKLTVPPRQ